MTSPAATPRLLVVEDDADIAELIAMHLAELPAHVAQARDGVAGLRMATSQPWDAIVLDLRLPGMGGLDLCRELRAHGNRTPLMMLTARGSELDRVLGLETGADDYLTKPFSVLELKARIKALLRRAAAHAPAPERAEPRTIEVPGLLIDREQRRVRLDGSELALTAREFDLLWHFARHPGRVFTRGELLADVWGYGHDGYDHTVNSHINRLRDKLGDQREKPRFIHTVWGVGYRFEVAA
jgi:DNA-binding response OmpR family regulator